MIALDTNVLLRYLVEDDAVQFKHAVRVIESANERGESCFLDGIVLCEAIWVLESGYKYSKSDIVKVLRKIVTTKNFEIESRDAVLKALDEYEAGKGDFSDYLIGHINEEKGCEQTYTFDKALKNSPRFALINAW